MTTASVRTGTPVGQVLRSRARRPSRKVMRLTIATATDSNRTVSARVRLPATVPVPADPRRAAAWLSIRVMRSRTSSARKSSKSAKCRCRTPLATPASVVTARVLSALGPSRSRMRSAVSNSCSRTSRRATPVGTVHLLLAVRGVARLTSGHASTRVDTCPLYRRNERPYPEASLISTDRSRSRSARTPAGGVLERVPAAARGSGRLLCGLPPSAARVAVQLGEAGPGYVLGVVCQGGRRNPGSGRVRRLAAVAVRLGAVLHPGRVAGPGTYSRRPQPASAGQAGNVAGRHRRRHRRGQGGFTMRYTTVVVTAVRTDGT